MSDSTIPIHYPESTETWAIVPGTDGLYSASNFGRIRSEPVSQQTAGRQRGRVLSPIKNRKGYRWFRACFLNRKSKGFTVHKAVALTFLGPIPQGLQVNHKDGNKENNRPENLEYVSCRDNIRHCWDTGLHVPTIGENHGLAKLTDDDVRNIRASHPAKSLAAIASTYHMTKQAIWHVVKRKTWTHVK